MTNLTSRLGSGRDAHLGREGSPRSGGEPGRAMSTETVDRALALWISVPSLWISGQRLWIRADRYCTDRWLAMNHRDRIRYRTRWLTALEAERA